MCAAALAVALPVGCTEPPAAVPGREVRDESYARLGGGVRLLYGPILAELYADSVVTTWGDVSAAGIDNVATNWNRIVTEAHVDQTSRTIVSSTLVGTEVLRDSGKIVLRLKDTVGKRTFRDTTMKFVTRWVREKRPNRWVIAVDSIIP